MAKFTDAPDKPAPPKERRKMITRLRPDGSLEGLYINPKTADDLESRSYNSQFDPIDAYMAKALSGGHRSMDPLEVFTRIKAKLSCYYCEDLGVVGKEIVLDGRPYGYAFRCSCQERAEKPKVSAQVTSIHKFVAKGLHREFCRLGGPDGSLCPLTAKEGGCFNHQCPKFP